jgi:geranylgeranyl diphosphate synthase type I
MRRCRWTSEIASQRGLHRRPVQGGRGLLFYPLDRQIFRAFGKADKQQRKVLETNFGQPRVDAKGIAAVQDVLRKTGALAAVETVISELTAASLAALAHAPLADEEVREALRVLTDRAVNRTV